ncbi:MAG: sugar nucleotide-binding protein [Vicinamibacteria bacterium]|nr:sugar nucleotide-binding protein [Vicinamibacteria bacterium]
MNARVLVTGAGGLLGGALCQELATLGLLVTAGIRSAPAPTGFPTARYDLERPETASPALAASRAEVVIHCAALADADACERDPGRARSLNVEATVALAEACARAGARLAFVSTDLVFGAESDPGLRSEDYPARPLSAYGRTKLAAEGIALRVRGNAVFRVALVTGRGHGPRGSATEAVAWALGAGRPLRLFDDQYRTPVDPRSLARLFASWAAGAHDGLFHAGGPERVSRLELGRRVATTLGLPVERIAAAGQDDVPALAARPKQAAMDSGRARRLFGWEPEPLLAAIRAGRSSTASGA